MKLSWEVDGVDITVGKLEDGIEAGMERAVENILEVLERSAKDTIRTHDRIFNKELLRSFDDQTGNADIENGLESRFLNVARHAGAVEYGVHPSKYTDGGPPISALMPWVLENLQDWNLEGGDAKTGGNSLKQPLHEEVTQSVTSKIDLFDTTFNGDYLLDRTEKENLENSLRSSNLDDTSVNAMFNQVKSWKVDSNPDGRHTDYVVQYSSDVKNTFDITGTIRGTDLYTPEPTYSETEESLRTLHEISKAYAYNHLDDGGGKILAGRWAGVEEMSRLGVQIWDNPSASEWTIDNNIVRNYSTNTDDLKSIFDKGLRHDELVDIEDDLLFTIDQLVDGRNSREAEIHIRGGDGISYHKDDLTLTQGRTRSANSNDVITDDFINGDFSAMSDGQLLLLANLIKAMGEKDVTVESQMARDRLNAWLDVFLGRILQDETDTDAYKWEQYVDRITS